MEIDDLEELPHYDTVNDFLSGLEVSELEDIRTNMIKDLLKKRSFERYRANGKEKNKKNRLPKSVFFLVDDYNLISYLS